MREKDAAWTFLADRDVAQADRIEARLEARVKSLAILPRQGRPIVGTDRRNLSIPDIQYVVSYRIDERDDTVRILRLWSTAQDRSE